MSLHDQLLADLEEFDDDDLAASSSEEEDDEVAMADDDTSGAPKVDIEMLKETSVRSIAKLWDSTQLKRVLTSIEQYMVSTRKDLYGPIEEDPEYKLIVEANNLTVEIDSEINIIHKFVQDHYAKRFPELFQLVLNPLDFIKTVKIMQNEMDVTKLELSVNLIIFFFFMVFYLCHQSLGSSALAHHAIKTLYKYTPTTLSHTLFFYLYTDIHTYL